MCQLLGMNCATPTDFSFSLRGFVKRGGGTDIHSHGWGMCVYPGTTHGAIRCFHDTLPACISPLADFIQQYPMQSLNMLAHIRYATQGEVSLENVHPFSRVWKGVQMTFCHNGDCPQFGTGSTITSTSTQSPSSQPPQPTVPPQQHQQPSTLTSPMMNVPVPLLGQTTAADVIYHPVGDTDSEAVFCAILNALHVEFPHGLPTLPVLHEFLSVLCNEIIETHPESTIFNFLLGCGQYTLFAYSWPGKRPTSEVWNGLYYIVREPPFSTAKLLDTDYEIDFRRVTTPNDRVAVITTKPLTEETGWTEFRRNELIMFNRGIPYRTPKCCEVVEEEGCGLYSKTVTLKCHSRSPKLNGCNGKSASILPPPPPPRPQETTTNHISNNSSSTNSSSQNNDGLALERIFSLSDNVSLEKSLEQQLHIGQTSENDHHHHSPNTTVISLP